MIKHVYKQRLSDLEHNDRKIMWAILVKRLLSELGFHEVWLQQNVGDHRIFYTIFKQCSMDNFIQLWSLYEFFAETRNYICYFWLSLPVLSGITEED